MKNKSLYEPRKLTYEEHKNIDDFFRYFNEKGKDVFDLLRQSFGDHENPVHMMAEAVNLLSCIPHYCENKSCFDRPRITKENSENAASFIESEEFQKWQNLYHHMGMWNTQGWKK